MAKVTDYDFYCEVALKQGAEIIIEYESNSILAFHHTKPSFERHIVVIPKTHIHDIRYVDSPELIVELVNTAKSILNKWGDDYINKYGAKIVTNLGLYQDSPHLHFHVLGGKKL
jgi:histidine triad (HIT) family protein